jgi:Glycosyl transferase family 2
MRGPPIIYWGAISYTAGIALYSTAVILSILRLVLWLDEPLRHWVAIIIWYSGVPTTVGLLMIGVDLAFLFPFKRKITRREDVEELERPRITVALTAYNDEASISDAVRDFVDHPLVRRVIVVSNNSRDSTEAHARGAGAIVYNEPHQGYGHCVYRCLQEALRYEDTNYIVLSEGDRTFRARDIDKLVSYRGHADVVNGTRIVEQLRAYRTQLTTLMYYGNFFVGKLLELKHFGKGTFTDVGTTYKLMRRDALARLLPHLDPRVNLEFNAHFMDTALRRELFVLECPITFHARVGKSKGGNVDNLRAFNVGVRMVVGLSFGWRWVRQ